MGYTKATECTFYFWAKEFFIQIYNWWRDWAKNIADKVVKKIRTKHTFGGKKLFAPKDYLTREQIYVAFSRMAKQYRTGKLTKPTQKDKQVEITFREKDDQEYTPDNNETIIELQAITNQLENFNISDLLKWLELQDKKNIGSFKTFSWADY